MVKVDVHRDYYADLGLGPSAEAEDVKKQFRKLGEQRKALDPDRLKENSLNQIASPQVSS